MILILFIHYFNRRRGLVGELSERIGAHMNTDAKKFDYEVIRDGKLFLSVGDGGLSINS